MHPQAVVAALAEFGKYELPENVRRDILDLMARYGRLKLLKVDQGLELVADDDLLITELIHHKAVRPLVRGRLDRFRISVEPAARGAPEAGAAALGLPGGRPGRLRGGRGP